MSWVGVADFILGELLLKPKRLRRLAWDELDALYAGQRIRQERELVGFRQLATQLYNLFPDEKLGVLTPAQYLPLPLIDPPVKPAPPRESAEAFRKRLEEQNRQTLAARAASAVN